jgi:RimJ/RimL family protein N-acetyltransferase
VLPESARLQFREMSPDDIDDMAALLGDPEVMAYYQAPKTRAEAWQWIGWNRGLYRSHGYGLWIVSLTAIIHPGNRPSQRVAEKIGLNPEKRTRDRAGQDVVLYAADW